ncbi:putative mycofactocin binding protein MftB [Frankia torreyi]|uniref:Putative mycofactocin binding protein MftB n=1 Tax=Frankia torreyi TaxID=1856 RepID=A0A0D8BME5_9ACTN|nr:MULTISPECIES: mycofactocin biosynthesis chaperone MftB [Frankia]KJE25373.1 putative mycofactocin binding protein MftB [Frankia torreyi]KQC37219.1 mycofactocin system protein MftB [Frankia sp. ACN1ag]KQM07811.1 putative mycofactocin binding protein MftB [Frankia sp. CpI1-P]
MTDERGAAGLSPAAAAFDLDRAWRLHPQVSVRPESFGALLYHFGTRKLSFLKEPGLLALVEALPAHTSARAAAAAVGLPTADLGRYQRALATLAASSMIVEGSTP